MEMVVGRYYEELAGLFLSTTAQDETGKSLGFHEAIAASGRKILDLAAAGGKLLFIGNGANASIASHLAADFSKNASIPAQAFNDAVLLTAAANDCGVEEMFTIPLRVFAKSGDILIAMSSSGKSPNILAGVEVARECGCEIITLSGFGEDNPLRKVGTLNFYTPADSYALVEVTHHSICHSILDGVLHHQAGG